MTNSKNQINEDICIKEITKLLQKYNCILSASMLITQNSVTPQITVMTKQEEVK